MITLLGLQIVILLQKSVCVCVQTHAVEVEVRIRHFCEDGFAKFPSDCGSSASMLIKLVASANSQLSAHTD